jgi:hypothetical protein
VLYCTIAAASFTCGVWFSRAVLPPVGRNWSAFNENPARADVFRSPDSAASPASTEDPILNPASGDGSKGLDELRERYRTVVAQAANGQLEIARLRQQLASAQSHGPDPNPSGSSQPTAAPHNPLEDPFYPPDPKELSALAKSCMVRVDQPKLLDSTPGDVGEAADAMNATPDEVRAMNEAMRTLHASFRNELRVLYEEAMGHPADSELSPRAMLGEFQDKRPPMNAGLFNQIARERSGELPVPDLSGATPYERAERLYLGLGDEFQNRVSQVLGPERASVLRAASGGWKWSRSVFSGCDR